MARGWESKSVEMQVESTESARDRSAALDLSESQIARARERESLDLSRRRVLHDLEKASHPRYRKVLLDSLAYLEGKMKLLDDDVTS